jgi:SRSO17 transposase
MIERAIGAKVPFTWFAAAEVYGDNGPLRASLEGGRISYVLAVSCDHRVPADAGHAIRADKLAARLPGRAWQRASAGVHGRSYHSRSRSDRRHRIPQRRPGRGRQRRVGHQARSQRGER